MTDTDQILALLNGLGDEYESIVAIICSREIPYTLQHANTLLLSHEGRILQKHSAANDRSVNLANNRKSYNGTSQNNHQGGRGYNGYRGRGRGGRSNNNRPQCQLCGKIGHTVIKCYYRFDQNFQGKTPFDQAPTEALIAIAQNTATDKNWYPDSGATNHVTKDIQNLSCGTNYNGTQKIHMGNGKGLFIKHIGKTTIPSSFYSHSLSLNNILHVPSITKNLLSVSKFCLDNKVFFEFHPFFCFVKYQVTKKLLLKGTLHKGLYRLDPLLPIKTPRMTCQPSFQSLISETT
ncbi:hypothetical protein UlMin_016581 [Ulmus minor]